VTVLVALFLGLVLPGIAAGVLLTSFTSAPSRPGALLVRTLSLGVGIWLTSSAVLARTIEITEGSSWVSAAILTLVSLVVLVLPRSRAVLRVSLPELGYGAALLLVTALTWLPVGTLVFGTTWAPLGSTPWYYWSLATKIADSGQVPDTTREWGTFLPFLGDYQFFSTATAMLLTQDGLDSVRAIQAVTLLSVVLIGCGAALLANALGSGRLASLAAVPIAVATGASALRLTSYRPESFALGLALLLVALCVDWFRHRERVSLAAACLLAAVLSQVHGIALVSAGVLVTAAALALWPRDGGLSHLRRCAASGLALAGSTLLAALVFGSASGAGYAGQLQDESGLADPTWEFVRAIDGDPPSIPPDNTEIARGAVEGMYQGTGWWVGPLVVVATVLLVIGIIRRAGASRMLVLSILALIGLAAFAALFAFGWSSYVPRRTGAQRLVQEASLLTGPYVACGLACISAFGLRLAWRQVVSVAVVVLLVAAGATASFRLEEQVASQRPPQEAVAALRDLRLPPRAVVLANAYTEGYIGQVTGAQGLLEGRAPYTFPRVLDRANALLRRAQSFYTAPAKHLDFLARHDVSYVVVANRRGYALASSNVFETPARASVLDRCPGFEPVLSDTRLRVYRVSPSTVPQCG
jgi:hypothetical protein